MSDYDCAIVFPGQGAQEVGMGRDFRGAYAVSRDVFDEADEAVGFKLSKIIFEGPEDELTKTAITQPAILVTSVAILRAVGHELGKEPRPKFYAGHSLGEYTALVADGVLTLGDAARLVHKRGALMQEAVPLGEGAMAAVMGLDMAAALEVCALAAGSEVCGPANVNSPGQIVISGNAGAVARAGEIAKERGASRVIPLKVSAPFHCALMRPVADKLMEAFAACDWKEPKIPIMANADASAKESADAIKSALYEQTYKPVLWADGVLSMAGAGAKRFAEFGPGNVLSGLIKRTAKGVPALSVNKIADVGKAVDFLNGAAQ
ncbi:MAG: ACP S-malonyltransferase [Synergistaceae bacterium]|jgi:[acyl-carrier-protein] S-malonyltransferase|nr:ACP S-malonyltransferase [Synergistaceae bacterium]